MDKDKDKNGSEPPATGKAIELGGGTSTTHAFPGPQHPDLVNTFFSEVVDYIYLNSEILVRIERTNDLGPRCVRRTYSGRAYPSEGHAGAVFLAGDRAVFEHLQFWQPI